MATDSRSLSKHRVAFHDTVSVNQTGALGIGEMQTFKKNKYTL